MRITTLGLSLAILLSAIPFVHAAPSMTVQSLGVNPNGNLEWAVIIDPDPTTPNNGAMAVEIGISIDGSSIVGYDANSAVWSYNNPGQVIFGWEQSTDVDPGPGINNNPVGVQTNNAGPLAALTSKTSNGNAGGDVAPTSAGLLGDYNQNGVVAAEDFTIWGNQLGLTVPPGSGADGNGDGNIGQEDYNLWAANFGFTAAIPPVDGLAVIPDASIFIALGSANVGDGSPVTLLTFETLGTVPTTVSWGGAYGGNARLAQGGLNFDTSNGSTPAVPEPSAVILAIFALLAAIIPRQARH